MWERIREVFEAALEQPEGARKQFVRRECSGDEELLQEVLSLLEADKAVGLLHRELPIGNLALAAAQLSTGTVVMGATSLSTPFGRPESIGPYLVDTVIGYGGMGVVYRAAHRESGQHVAVKTVRVLSANLLSSFRREMAEISRISHPCIVRVIDSGVQDDVPWYAMELLDGRTLAELISDAWRPKDPDERAERIRSLLKIIRDLCPALEFIHGEGIVHRDIKPENIVVQPNGMPVLVDFGIAASFASTREVLDASLEGAGTTAYMSPEQIRGETADARSDLYALGCVLFQILTGTVPFANEDRKKVIAGHLEQLPQAPSVVAGTDESRAGARRTQELDALVLGLLAKAPRDRIGHAGAVGAALEAAGIGSGHGRSLPAPRQYLYRPSFAGREHSLERLDQCLTGLLEGEGGLVFVAGVSGVGKTRLMLEFSRRARKRGAHVLTGECTPPSEGSTSATQPLVALAGPLSAIVDRCRERGRLEADRLFGSNGKVLTVFAPAVASLPGQDAYAAPPALDDASSRERLFRALASVLTALAAERPVVLILDDLQWADELTLGLADHLRREVPAGVPLLIIGTFRSDESSGQLAELASADGTETIDLGRLGDDAVASIVGEMLAAQPAPLDLSRFVAAQSEGNPFFVAEYLRAAVEEGLLNRDTTGEWRVSGGEFERLGLPGSLRSVVSRRLADLPVAARRAVTAAAVIGREFHQSVLAAVFGPVERDLLDAMGELVRRQVFEELPSGRLRFAHDSLREVSYSEIPSTELPSLHHTTAVALSSSASASSGELGRHWELAGERALASECYLTAAREARARWAGEATERYYKAVIAIGEPAALGVEARLELASPFLRWQGRVVESGEHLRAAIDIARGLGDKKSESTARRKLGSIHFDLAQLAEAREVWEVALKLAREAGDRQGEARTLLALGHVACDGGRPDDAEQLYLGAIEISRAVGERLLEGDSEEGLANLYEYRRSLAETRELHERALEKFREVGSLVSEAVALGNLSTIRFLEGELGEARRLALDAIQMHRMAGNRRFVSLAMGTLASVEFAEGRVEEGRRLFAEVLADLRECGFRQSEATVMIRNARCERRFGDVRAAAELLDRASSILEAHYLQLAALCACEQGRVAVALGRAADEYLRRAESIAETIGAHPDGDVGIALAGLRAAVGV